MMLRQQMQSARFSMSSKPFFLSQLRLVPKDWARGQLCLRVLNYKRLQVKDCNYSTTKDTSTYNNNEMLQQLYKNTQDTNRQD
jgi:hypothetical protein